MALLDIKTDRRAEGGYTVWMTEREKVIKGLECCIKHDPDDKPRCNECPYDGACLNRLKYDALALLQAQGAVKVKIKCNTGMTHWYACGACDASVDRGDRFCRRCGRVLVWDEQEKLEKKAAEMYRSQVGEGMGGR